MEQNQVGGTSEEDTECGLVALYVTKCLGCIDRLVLTHICQDMTNPPLIEAGVFSAAKTGTVLALAPIPIPSKRRVTLSRSQQERPTNKAQLTKSCSHVWEQADPITVRVQKIPQMKIVPRRPNTEAIFYEQEKKNVIVSTYRYSRDQ